MNERITETQVNGVVPGQAVVDHGTPEAKREQAIEEGFLQVEDDLGDEGEEVK